MSTTIDRMTRMYGEYLGMAQKLTAEGFTSKAAQKRANLQVTYALECVTKMIREVYLAIPHADRTPEQEGIYWMLPMYPHQLKAGPIREAVAAHMPNAVRFAALLQQVWEMHLAVKDTPVVANKQLDRSAGRAVAGSVPVVEATFQNRGGVLIVSLPDGRSARRITIRPYRYASIVENADGTLALRHCSTVSLDPILAEITREAHYRKAPLMIAKQRGIK